MGINAQQILQSDPDFVRRQLAAQQMQQFNPTGSAAGAIGSLLGRGVGNIASGRGFFDVADPGLKRVTDIQSIMKEVPFDAENPREYYMTLAKQLEERGYGDLAPLAVAEAAKIKDATTADPKKQAEAIVLRVSQIPEEDRTEEDNRQLAAANQLLNRAKDTTVQSSKILDDGTTVQIMSNGTTVVTNAEGTVLTGADRAKAVRDAQRYGTEIFGERQRAGAGGRLGVEAEMRPIIAGGERGAVVAQDIVKDTFKQSGLVRKNIDNLQKALQLVEKEGATTGVIAEKFPDWKASTIALRNVQNELGLDIVGAVTFGALSEGELRLALDTGLPTNLEPPDLAKWIKDKIAAQEKLLGYLNEQARFLSRPGRNLGDWLDEVDRKGREQPADSAEAKLRRLQELRRKAAGGQ